MAGAEYPSFARGQQTTGAELLQLTRNQNQVRSSCSSACASHHACSPRNHTLLAMLCEALVRRQ
jgi:hypothetical protein